MVEVSTEQIGKWYKQEFEALDKEIPLKERYVLATDIVKERIKQYKRTIPLPSFFRKIWDDELLSE